jgi:hypothetical protein
MICLLTYRYLSVFWMQSVPLEYFYQVRKNRRNPLKADDIEPDIDWARDFGSRSSRGSRHAAGGDSNENEYVKVKQEVIDDDDVMETDDVSSKYSFVKLNVVEV